METCQEPGLIWRATFLAPAPRLADRGAREEPPDSGSVPLFQELLLLVGLDKGGSNWNPGKG